MTITRNKVIALVVIVLAVNIAQWFYFTHLSTKAVDKISSTSETEVSTVYMICDVFDVVYNGNTVEVDIVLPNGNLLTRLMHVSDDLPEDFDEVIIQTSDLDDYTTYKIVGMR